jgi:hypothetical protein
MTSTLELTPAAAGRFYRGPRFHTARDRLILDQIRTFKASAEASIRYLGHVLEAIAKFKTQSV